MAQQVKTLDGQTGYLNFVVKYHVNRAKMCYMYLCCRILLELCICVLLLFMLHLGM